MATKPLTTEAIALTEKKMDMTLDDIIKMSKKNSTKGKRPPRPPIKKAQFQNNNASQFQNNNAFQGNNRLQRFMDSRSSIRQGALAKRRSNFNGNQFPVTTEIARKAAVLPARNRGVNHNGPRVPATVVRRNLDSSNLKEKVVVNQRPHTLDALFANMKEQRMKLLGPQKVNRGTTQNGNRGTNIQIAQRRNGQRQQQPGRGGGRGGSRRQFSNFTK